MYFGTTVSSWNTAITSYLMRPKRKSIIPHHSIIIRFFLFILFVEREYLSGLIDIRPLRSISTTQEGVEELFFKLY